MKISLKSAAAIATLMTIPFVNATADTVSNGLNTERQLTRAEVKADLAIWKRAGMDRFWRGDLTPDIYSREYKAAYAEYIRMRNGPEYQQELARMQ